MQSCCYMQSSTQSVGLKNGFFFRTTHFPSHFWLSFAAGHQPLGGLLDPCRDQTSFHGGGKWWGSWGLGTQNFLDSGRWNLLWEEWWITPLKNRFRYQDISRYHRWWNIPCFLTFQRHVLHSGELPRSHNSPCEMSLRMAQGFNAQAGLGGCWGRAATGNVTVVEITTNSVFGVISLWLWTNYDQLGSRTTLHFSSLDPPLCCLNFHLPRFLPVNMASWRRGKEDPVAQAQWGSARNLRAVRLPDDDQKYRAKPRSSLLSDKPRWAWQKNMINPSNWMNWMSKQMFILWVKKGIVYLYLILEPCRIAGGSSHGVQTRWVKQVSQILATNKHDLNLESPRNNRMVMVRLYGHHRCWDPTWNDPEASGADGEHCSAGEGEEQRSPGGASEVKLVAGSIENIDPRNMVPQTLNIIKHYEALFLGVNQMITIFDFAELENRDFTWSHFW